jgi:hypothetical protein
MDNNKYVDENVEVWEYWEHRESDWLYTKKEIEDILVNLGYDQGKIDEHIHTFYVPVTKEYFDKIMN